MKLVDAIIWIISIAGALVVAVIVYAFYTLIKVLRETEDDEPLG